MRWCEGEVVWVCLSAVGGQTASGSTGEEGAGGRVETKSELLCSMCVGGELAMSCTYKTCSISSRKRRACGTTSTAYTLELQRSRSNAGQHNTSNITLCTVFKSGTSTNYMIYIITT